LVIVNQGKLKIIVPIFILITTINFYYSIYKPKQQKIAQTDNQHLSVFEISQNKFVKRGVASVPDAKGIGFVSLEKEQRDELQFQTELRLSCKDLLKENSPSASVSSNHVILSLSKCSSRDLTQAFAKKQVHGLASTSKISLKEVDLTNLTNGYKAQIFRQADDSLNSDFIQLDKGYNTLQFHIRLNDGQMKSQTFKIHRVQ